MNQHNRFRALALFLFLPILAACGGDGAGREATPTEPPAVEAVLEDGVQVARVTVTGSGYEPDRIRLRPGVPARLVFVREVEGECAEQVRIPALNVPVTALPLNEPVAVEFTPAAGGEFTFACGMDMMKGTLVVEG